MKGVNVPKGMQVVLRKDRDAYPAEQLTNERAIVVRERAGRVLDEDRVLGWLIPKEMLPLELHS